MVSDKNIKVNTNSSEKPIEKQIRGSALYYSTSQVATVLGETDSKIRYYTNVFDSILSIEISNKQRRYTNSDIEKMRFLIELKNEGMTIKQIQEYCQQVSFDENKIEIKENNPLSIQTMAKALLEEQKIQLEDFKIGLLKELTDHSKQMIIMNQKMLEESRLEVAITVDDVVAEKNEELKSNIELLVSERINDLKIDIQESLEKQLEENQRSNEIIDKLRISMKENKKKSEEKENEGFFKRLFKR